MNLKVFLEKELKDNTSYTFSHNEVENLYFCKPNNIEKYNQKIEVSKSIDKTLNRELRNLAVLISQKLREKDFIKENVFSFNSNEYEHNTSDLLFEYKESHDNVNFLDKAELVTGNLVGFIKHKKYSINITSRFGNIFLECLIADTDGFLEIENFGNVENEGLIEWLLIILWKSKLRKAYRLGLPKEYVSINEFLPRIRGNLNINNFLLSKNLYPPYKCSYREHSFDNPTTQIINFAFKCIENKSLITDFNKIQHDFIIATKDKKHQMQSLLKFKGIKNPFYNDYNEVIKLSKSLINKEMYNMGEYENEFSAFLFDISMLFEFFIRKIFIRNGYYLEEKDLKKYKINRGIGNIEERELRPDIIIVNKDNSIQLFDVKYKNFNYREGVNREDLFQLHTYLGNLLNNNTTVSRCGFVYPIRSSQIIDNKSVLRNEIIISDKIIKFEIHFFVVPDEISEEEKRKDSKEYFELFKKSITQFLNDFNV